MIENIELNLLNHFSNSILRIVKLKQARCIITHSRFQTEFSFSSFEKSIEIFYGFYEENLRETHQNETTSQIFNIIYSNWDKEETIDEIPSLIYSSNWIIKINKK